MSKPVNTGNASSFDASQIGIKMVGLFPIDSSHCEYIVDLTCNVVLYWGTYDQDYLSICPLLT